MDRSDTIENLLMSLPVIPDDAEEDIHALAEKYHTRYELRRSSLMRRVKRHVSYDLKEKYGIEQLTDWLVLMCVSYNLQNIMCRLK